MSNQQAPLNLDQLLRSGAAAAQGGNRAAARAIFLALSREHPDDPRVWLGLAGTATNAAEQRSALEQTLALDPANERARMALERLGGPTPGTTLVLPETLAQPAPQEAAHGPPDDEPAPRTGAYGRADDAAEPAPQRSPFPLLNLLATLLILLLLGAVGVVIGQNLLGQAPAASAPQATPALAAVATEGLQPTPSLAAPTAPPLATAAPPEATGAPAPTAQGVPPTGGATTPAPEATAAPAPKTSAELPLGQVIDYDGWSATLLQPDYAVSLDGAIGDLQPAGRFVLAVVAVSNNSPNPRQIPPDLFALVDSAERSYLPVPGASSAYLALYERGQRGDLALEDTLEPASGMRSVPLLFDVPPEAGGLRLTMSGAAGAGWPIGGGTTTPAGP